MFRRGAHILIMLAGALLALQFPEFYQQYLQRLSGRLDVLEQRVGEIRSDAALRGLNVEAYVTLFTTSPDHALEGGRMLDSLQEEASLRDTQAALLSANPLEQLPRFLFHFDLDLANSTLAIFKPAIPLGRDSILYGGVGAGTALVLAAAFFKLHSLLCEAFRKIGRFRNSSKNPDASGKTPE